MEFMFGIPSFVHFGPGAARKAGDVAKGFGAAKVFFISDKGVQSAGLTEPILSSLKDAGLEVLEFYDVQPNPPDSDVAAAAVLARQFGSDVIVALGGGSAIDCAKAVNILLTNPNPINQYDGLNLVKNPVKPLVAIPTTSGTASEVTAFTIITDTERRKKMVIGGQFVGATMALVDPEMTMGMPPAITASTGMDALTHAIEAYLSKNAMPPTDLFALKSIELIMPNLPVAFREGRNVDARSNMLLGCMYAGYAFNSAVLGLVHSIAHPLSVHCGLPHGVANAACLPHVMNYNAPEALDRMKDIALAMGLDVSDKTPQEAAELAVRAVKDLSKDLNIPTLEALGVSREQFDRLADDALKEISTLFNPRQPTKDDVKNILEQAF